MKITYMLAGGAAKPVNQSRQSLLRLMVRLWAILDVAYPRWAARTGGFVGLIPTAILSLLHAAPSFLGVVRQVRGTRGSAFLQEHHPHGHLRHCDYAVFQVGRRGQSHPRGCWRLKTPRSIRTIPLRRFSLIKQPSNRNAIKQPSNRNAPHVQFTSRRVSPRQKNMNRARGW